MSTYEERLEAAKEYIANAGIHFSPYQLANLFSGLDFERYEIIKLIPRGARSIVIIQKCKDPKSPHYCLQYRGSGKYFSNFKLLRSYYEERFHDNKLRGVRL